MELSFKKLFLIISELAEHFMEVWNKTVYWQFSDQINNFKKLTDALANDVINAQARIHIARETSALILGLHAKTFIQEDFKEDDINVNLDQQVFFFVVSVLRHKNKFI